MAALAYTLSLFNHHPQSVGLASYPTVPIYSQVT